MGQRDHRLRADEALGICESVLAELAEKHMVVKGYLAVLAPTGIR